MKASLLASAALLPLLAGAAAAQDFSPHGRIDEFAGITYSPELQDEVYNLGVGASLDFPFTDTYGVQLDGSVFMSATNDGGVGAGDGTFTVYRRDAAYGLGAFVSTIDANGFFVFGGGVTGLVFTERVTYFGSLEVIDAEGTSDPLVGGALGGTYFLQPDTAITGQTAFGVSTGDGDEDIVLGLGLGAEHRFSGSPLSVGAEYGFTAGLGGGSTVAHTAQVNLSYHFGTESLQDQSRTGPSFPGGFSVFNLFGF